MPFKAFQINESAFCPRRGILHHMTRLRRKRWFYDLKEHLQQTVTALIAVALLVSSFPVPLAAQAPAPAQARKTTPARPVRHGSPAGTPTGTPAQLPDSIPLGNPVTGPAEVVEDEIRSVDGKLKATPVDTLEVDINEPLLQRERQKIIQDNDTLALTAGEAMAIDSLLTASAAAAKEDEWVPREVEFTPDPTKAVWMSALFPGLGQIYNRRYWKLPIIVGGYLGLAYATDWNSGMLRDYTRAYADLLDNDPNTRSYMDLFSPNVKEESLDRQWLQNVLRSRKNYFRRNRDLCIICMVGVYLLAMVDAYVDASLSHFDISPDLSMDLAPSLMQDGRQRYPSVGLVWALNF